MSREHLRSEVSWFPKAIKGPIKDMHIVHVLAPAWRGPRPPRYLGIPNEVVFGNPERWINLEDIVHRARMEKRETKRLSESEPAPLGRKRSGRAANQCYESYRRRIGRPCKSTPREDVRWTVQCIAEGRQPSGSREHGFFDELLYRLYSKNLDVFGDKAASDLYVFDIGHASCMQLKYIIHKKDSANETSPVRSGLVRLRLYAIIKELAYPPLDDFNHTFFSPIIALAAVLSPVYDVDDRTQAVAIQQVLDLSLDLDDALFEDLCCEEKSEEKPALLDEFIVRQARCDLKQLPSVDWSKLVRSPLTQFSVFVVGLSDDEVPQRLLCDPAASLANATEYSAEQSLWRTRFMHYIARVCVLGFQITADTHGLWESEPQPLRCVREFADLNLRKLVKRYLPRRSGFSVTSDAVGVASPGRKVLIRSLGPEQIEDIRKRSLKKCGDFPINGEYDGRDVLDSVAWNVLLCSLVASQEALLARFHGVISENGDITDVKAELKEFDDFYDVELFDLPKGAFYQDSFNDLKYGLDLDRQYEMLHRKLEITVGNIHADNLKWAIVAFLFAGFMALQFHELAKWLIVTIFSSVAIGLVIVRPGWSQLKLFLKKMSLWFKYAPALIREWREMRAP